MTDVNAKELVDIVSQHLKVPANNFDYNFAKNGDLWKFG